MKKAILSMILALICAVSFGQKKDTTGASKHTADTVVVDITKTRILMINGKPYAIKAFTEYNPVFLPRGDWDNLINIVDTRTYGTIPGSAIQQLLAAIVQQINR